MERADKRAALVGARAEVAAEKLAGQLDALAHAGGLGGRLRDRGVTEGSLPELAQLAATQWTGTFNPRLFDAGGALEIYRAAY